MSAPSKTAAEAAAIRKVAAGYGLTVTASISRDYNPATGEMDGKALDASVTAETEFTPGDAAAYRLAEGRCNDLLRLIPMIRPGTVWGTDSGSVGGAAGLHDGVCRLSKSGVPIGLARELAKTA